jgi:CHAD domain-containing protein
MDHAAKIWMEWNRQHEILVTNLQKIREGHHGEAIHDFRVAVKKTRAYLKLLVHILHKSSNDLKIPSTESLFDALGKLRDVEIAVELFNTIGDSEKINTRPFRKYLDRVKLQVLYWVTEALKNYDDTELKNVSNALGLLLKETGDEKLGASMRSAFVKDYERIGHLSHQPSSKTHELRKLLKNWYYWLDLAPAGLLAIDATKNKHIKSALERLGNWQDHDMLRLKIRHFRKDFVPATNPQYAALRELEKHLKIKMEEFLKKIKPGLEWFRDGKAFAGAN